MYTDQEITEIKNYAVKHVCPHFANNRDLDDHPTVIVRSDDCYVFDIEGRRYLDTFASLLTTVCGHNNQDIIEAINKQLNILDFFPNFGSCFSLPQVELAKKLKEVLPDGLTAIFYVNSGSEANETALKIARQYHIESGRPDKYKVIGRKGSYHGTTLGAISATGLPWFSEYFKPGIPGYFLAPSARCAHCDLGLKPAVCGMKCLSEMERLILENDPNTVSAIIMDPLPGSNTGYPIPPDGYLQGVRDLCDKYDIMLIFDEVQTGFGKSGEMFVCQYFDVIPDILTLGKGFSGGYIPLGAAVMRQDIYDAFRSAPGKELRSGSTFGGHNVACASAIACLDYIKKHNLLDNVKDISAYIVDKLKALMDKFMFIGAISGVGLLLSVELCKEREGLVPFDKEMGVGNFVQKYCYDNGLIMRNNGDIMVIAPSLTFTKEHADTMIDVFEKALIETKKHFDL